MLKSYTVKIFLRLYLIVFIDQCKGLCELVLPKDMDHIEFDFSEDFTTPLIEFLNKISFGLGSSRTSKINFSPELFQAPIEIVRTLESFRSPRY